MEKHYTHILLADDDADDTVLFEEALEELLLKKQFSHVEDGEQLLQFLKEQNLPDIVFLDLNMPIKNGKDCLVEIRGNRKMDNVPVVIYSTSKGKRDIDACYKLGASYYLVKPDNYSDIKKKLLKVFDSCLHSSTSTTTKDEFVL